MTVSSQLNRKSYNGDGASTSFATSPVAFFDDSDLEVRVVVIATGAETLLTLNTHYTVTGGDGAVGTVNLAGGSSPHGVLLTTERLVILRVVPLTQETDFVQNDPSDAEVAEDAIDKLTMMAQQLSEENDRTIKLPVGSPLTNLEAPSPSSLKFWRWNEAATALENASITGSGSIGLPVAVAEGGTGSATAGGARTNLDVDQAVNSRSNTETDVAENDLVGIRDVSASTDDKATVQNLFNVIGSMTALVGTTDPDADMLPVWDNSSGAPRQRKVPARLTHVPVRQTALAGNVDSNGYANFLTTGSGLRPGLLATSVALALTYAAGFDDLGEKNYYERFTADVSDILGADLPASNTSYIYRSAGAAWGAALVPPDYGYAFDRTRGALLNFEGADASTTFIDDFGNTWSAVGNAQIDTAQFKFGASSLLLDGTGDEATCTNITSLGGDSWEASVWFRLNATSAVHQLFAFHNAGGFGAALSIDHNAGNRRVFFSASSNGTSNDIANGQVGSTTTIALNTWYKARLVFDALAGTYRAYLSNNGAAETQEFSVASTARACAITQIRLGRGSGVSDYNGWLDAFRFVRAATATAAGTPSASAPTITDYPYHWFSIPAMQMFEVTAPSASAGVNPTLTARNCVFVGEADTSGAAVTAVRTYALRGEYRGPEATLPGSAALITNNHNIGLTSINVDLFVKLSTSDEYPTGSISRPYTSLAAGPINAPYTPRIKRNSVEIRTGASSPFVIISTAGAGVAPASGSVYFLKVKRDW